eukprot:scaffold7946_cov116-Isochrysis_galbana.AAC.7
MSLDDTRIDGYCEAFSRTSSFPVRPNARATASTFSSSHATYSPKSSEREQGASRDPAGASPSPSAP